MECTSTVILWPLKLTCDALRTVLTPVVKFLSVYINEFQCCACDGESRNFAREKQCISPVIIYLECTP